MSKATAERVIVISFAVYMASVIGGHLAEGDVKGKKPEEKAKNFGRKITSGFLAFVFASLLGEAAPELGALISLSLGSYAFLHDGLPAISKRYEPSLKGVTGSAGPARMEIVPQIIQGAIPTAAEVA